MNGRLAKAEAVFHEALELPPEQREAFLQQACGKDAELCREVEALLRASGVADRWLKDDPTEGERPREPERFGATGGLPITEKAGDRIGRYKLREQLGEGGCGVVYVAEQEEPVRRRVALKVIKLGMDSKSVVARFEAERQALAMMDHPNIAKVLDAGATDTGRPYFVMELVRGIKITEYCDQHKVSTRERLELFIKVCQAVQHAHQKGIIHRDLKPSNILVTLHDGVPVPKVIDFGIAKATEGRLTDATVYTQLHQLIGTPAYMSPEQAEMTSLDIDTRSDIYSLGVLLYELLTGRTPFDGKELLQAGLDEMLRTLREKEPVRPSTRLSTLQAADQTEVARRRNADAPRLIKLLRGDMDWIVMKALEKDRTRRYETANAFAQDIRRHLADEPVSASAPSAGYRFAKFARRHKTALAVAAAIAAILVVATLASTWQAIRATRERDEKEQARQEAEAISTFLTEVFQSPDPARDGRTITVAETLDRAARKLDTLAGQPAGRAKLQITLGATYQALGLHRDAIPLLERARDYYLATLGPEHPDTLVAADHLADSYQAAGRQEALKLREEVLALRRKVLGPEHPDTLLSMNNLTDSYSQAGRREEALKLCEEVLALCRKALGPEHDETLRAMHNLAASYHNAGRREEALRLEEEVTALRRKLIGPEHPDTLVTMNNLAASYSHAGRREEALKLQEEVLALSRKVNGPEHPYTLVAMGNLANSYLDAGRREEALKLQEEALALCRKVNGPEHPSTLHVMLNLANTYDGGRREEALKLQEEVLALSRKVNGLEHAETLLTMHYLANSYYDAGRREEALKLREEVLALRRKVLGPEHPETLVAMNNLAISYRTAGRREEALRLHEEVLPLGLKVNGPEHPDTLVAMHNLANSYFDTGRREEALKLRKEVLALRRKVNGPEHPDTLRAMHDLAICYHDTGRHEEELKLREEELVFRRKANGPDHPDTLRAMHDLASHYSVAGRREEELKLREEELALRRKVNGPEHIDTLQAMHNLAISYYDAGRRAEALKLREEVLPLRRKVLGPQHRDARMAMHNLAVSYSDAGKLDQAVPLFEDLLKIQRELDVFDVFHTMDHIAWMYEKSGRADSAEAFYREQLAQHGSGLASFGLGKLLLERAKSDTSDASRAQERAREGGQLLRDYLATARSRYTNDPTKLERSIYAVAELRYRHGQYAEAEPLYRELIQSHRSRFDVEGDLGGTASLARLFADWAWAERDGHGVPASAGSALPATTRSVLSSAVPAKAGTPYLPHERAREAERLLRECLAFRLRTPKSDHWRTADVKSRLGGALMSVAVIDPALNAPARIAKLAEAETLLLQGNEQLQGSRSAERKYKRDALERLVRLYQAWDKPEKLSEWQQKLEAFEAGESKSSEPEEEDTQ